MNESKMAEQMLGQVINQRYEILELIFEGRNSLIYRARHMFSDRELGVKFLVRTGSSLEVEMFNQEARLLAGITDPSVLQIFDFGSTEDGNCYYVFFFAQGITLESMIEKKGPLAPDQARKLFLSVAESMQRLHEKGIIHCNLAPSHILLEGEVSKSDAIKILGFRLSRFEGASDIRDDSAYAGRVEGTPFYMSPEMANGQKVDSRTDIYSLGCILFFTLTGAAPFEGDSMIDSLLMHINNEIPVDRIPQEFTPILLKSMAKKPEHRYMNMREFAEDISGKPD